ncbi:MAG TPA: haloacid dehalogenase-like hydrolase [Bryobacteraceae bacterium]|nr:haloacid dehalogenase-like hydrolase [Bryobacteraceae bacterium]
MVFDLDGTLLRGPTVCELLAAPLGRLTEMQAFECLTGQAEIAEARVEMARWYNGISRDRLLEFLTAAEWAPGAREGAALLQDSGVEVAIASITWNFAVGWFSDQLNVRHFLGTGLTEGGQVEHVLSSHKAGWLISLANQLRVPAERTAAVGDSSGDVAMLEAAALRFFIGPHAPSGLKCFHMPSANILELARIILAEWSP